MPKFALRFPYFILMLCLMVFLIGMVNLFSMPVDLFPDIDMPVVVVATFYNGMPPQQIEVYVDPLKLEARNLSRQDVVTAVNSSNLILPAGDVRIGNKDFNIYAN